MKVNDVSDLQSNSSSSTPISCQEPLQLSRNSGQVWEISENRDRKYRADARPCLTLAYPSRDFNSEYPVSYPTTLSRFCMMEI